MDYFMLGAQLILSLSILVILHELGHFIPARLFKTRVEKFYLFFDPWFSLFKVKKGDTEYGIGWLPLGGYVKIAGMLDESMDKEQLQQEPQPWEFRSKPAWQRLIIMAGGVTVNLILGMLIFTMVLFVWGKEYLPIENSEYGIMTDSLGVSAGFRNGDKIVSVNGEVPLSIQKAHTAALLNTPAIVKVKRGAETVEITVDQELAEKVIAKDAPFLFDVGFPVVAGEVPDSGAASKAGLKSGDRLLSVNGVQAIYFTDLGRELMKYRNQEAAVQILRGSDTLVLHPKVNEAGKIGFIPQNLHELGFKTETLKYGFFEAFPAGMQEGMDILSNYVKQFKLVFTEAGAKKVGGFISMAKQFDEGWDWRNFWSFTGVLSIILAFMNILPIPALDGGHILFLLGEMITGRKPSEKVMEYAQMLGMFLLLGLLLFANGNDIYRLFAK
ncbi:MAG: RIP metalloprotease RseP [Bacteroidia bacterium]|nr:RIP metalloprotease RseP [Bacteroidia bacterium]